MEENENHKSYEGYIQKNKKDAEHYRDIQIMTLVARAERLLDNAKDLAFAKNVIEVNDASGRLCRDAKAIERLRKDVAHLKNMSTEELVTHYVKNRYTGK